MLNINKIARLAVPCMCHTTSEHPDHILLILWFISHTSSIHNAFGDVAT